MIRPVVIYAYVIRSVENDRRYVGITADLDDRLRRHANKESKGGQLLGRFELIHTEEFENYSAARKREKFLKSGQGRRWLDQQFGHVARETGVDTNQPSPTVRGSSVRGVA